ncbi:M23 family metallopeptidase [Caldibacillus lycopersici]|uniref:M23 family metallopeptidase n=1 Tax=Perspicuibacillus lycopersici TaxID=1325689 RepID=A0AAE3LNL8_9BACI|nr:M23 family metallopeptidase [Perspicuibacillus lycopersici]MCU9614006.1 M23 family metallopeptidase [Perspicuibacillus lycopersici]
MSNRKEEIKRRIAQRKKLNRTMAMNSNAKRQSERPLFTPDYYPQEDKWFTGDKENNNETIHPLFRKEIFIFKLLAAACLVLVVAIIFQNPSQKLDSFRVAVKQVMEKDFQFATVSNWYEDTFGKPLALLPEQPKENTEEKVQKEFAMPANAKILEDFDSNKEGITIQTTKDAIVDAIQEGTVTFAGEKEGYGKTVIVQHPDSSETWYGELSEISVDLYDQVKIGDPLGKVSQAEDTVSGEFYFAIRKDEKFIDPVQVITFE